MTWRSSAPNETITTMRAWGYRLQKTIKSDSSMHIYPHTIGNSPSEPLHSDSLELSDADEPEDSPLSASRLTGTTGAAADAPPRFSKSSIRSSSRRIFSASFSSSMLLRLSPPVPVPLPVRLRLGCAGCRRGRRT